jgi:SAM-dependent methyltransferase
MGIKSILNFPAIYRLFFYITGTNHAKFVNLFVRPQKDDTILDIGCGPADILKYLPDVRYIGFDISQSYINAAVRRYKDRGTFFCKTVPVLMLILYWLQAYCIILMIKSAWIYSHWRIIP